MLNCHTYNQYLLQNYLYIYSMIDNIIFSKKGYYVEKIKDLYHVFVPDVAMAYCDSAYKENDLAIERCKYLVDES